MTQFLKRLWPEEEAQDLSEYALLLFLVSLTAITVIGRLGSKIAHVYSGASTQMTAATSRASLSGGSLAYSVQTQTNIPRPAKDDNKPNHP